MHILYFHLYFSTPNGASGLRSYHMARQLVREGHSVTMVCGSCGAGDTGLDGAFVRGRRSGIVDGIRVIEFDLSYSNRDRFVKRAATFLRYAAASVRAGLKEGCDLAFATTTPLTAGIPGIALRWLARKPFVFEVRDLWPELPREMGVIKNPVVLGLMSALEWTSYRSATRCVALSPGIAAGIARRGVAPSKIAMIPNASDPELFRKAARAPWRPPGVEKDDLMAIFTGAHGIANGLDAVLDAAASLKHRGRRDIKLVLVGDGLLKDQLIGRAEQEDLDNVVFLDTVKKAELAGLMASADLGIQCLANVPAFYFGTSPNKFFDYLAAGLPVLNNYPGWLAELIAQHDCGFAVPPENPDAFADALEQAADDRAMLARKGERAARLAHERFQRSTLAEHWVAWVTRGEQPTVTDVPSPGHAPSTRHVPDPAGPRRVEEAL